MTLNHRRWSELFRNVSWIRSMVEVSGYELSLISTLFGLSDRADRRCKRCREA